MTVNISLDSSSKLHGETLIELCEASSGQQLQHKQLPHVEAESRTLTCSVVLKEDLLSTTSPQHSSSRIITFQWQFRLRFICIKKLKCTPAETTGWLCFPLTAFDHVCRWETQIVVYELLHNESPARSFSTFLLVLHEPFLHWKVSCW